MLARILLATSLAACGSRTTTPRAAPLAQPIVVEAPAAGLPTLAPPAQRPWIRFMPQSTFFCVRLPDGQLRSTAYSVGGNHYTLHEGIELAHGERDALCTNYGVTVLGTRGQLGTTAPFQSNYGYYTPEVIEPDARSLGRLGVSRCFVDTSGVIACVNTNGTGAIELAALLNKVGPVDHMVPDAPCAVYRDGAVACATENGKPAVIPMFTNAVTASIVSLGWSKYAGCALLRTGKVSCIGHNALALRTFTSPEAQVPTEIAGLDGIEEVTSSGHTACARRGGTVWCWGETAGGQAGLAAMKSSKSMPRCVVDDVATARARAAFEAATRACRDPNRKVGHDDPMCRAMWQATPPGTIYKDSATPCDPSSGASSSRWSRPTRVDGIDDALAIGMNGGLTCALRPARQLTCWGNGVRDPKSITFPARTLAAEPAPPPNVASPRTTALVVSGSDVIVTSARGHHTKHALGAKLGAGVAVPGVVDVMLAPPCLLAKAGIACQPRPNATAPAFPDDTRDGIRISMLWGDGCVLRRDGLLRCGKTTPRDGGMQGWAARLGAPAPVVEHGGIFARYVDGTVGIIDRTKNELAIHWRDVVQLSVGSDNLTACVVLKAGTVECTGDNRFFQRGDRSHVDARTAIAGIPRASAVAASGTHACVLGVDGSVWCWGRATNGEAGAAGTQAKDPIYPDQVRSRVVAAPSQVPGITDAIAIGVGDGASCALTRTGELACWGAGSTTVRRVRTTIE